MGGYTFFQTGKGADVDEAFANAQDNALTREEMNEEFDGLPPQFARGSVAEKDDYTVIPESEIPDDTDPDDYAAQLIDENDSRVSSKWGAAGAVKVEDQDDTERWLFFGWSNY